ncbi:MAG: GNAT family N-acetyltransferase [Actinophytocola sp.]|uniref:GNAT family N-acetyltransferase n=1 Tax=Actinophytocola sp. TaxID=1872138 RepID=UPI003D6AD329
MTTLYTERLTLRPLATGDADVLVAVFADAAPDPEHDLTDPEVVAGMVRRHVEQRGSTGTGEWVVELDAEPVGIVQLRVSTEAPGDLLECGWYVAREHRGTGVAAEAARAILRHAHHGLAVPAVFSLVRKDNDRGRRFAERLGFVRVGAREHRGRPHDVLVSLATPRGVHHVELWVADLTSAEKSLGWLFTQLGWHEYQRWPRGVSWRYGASYVVVEDSPDRTGDRHDRNRPGLNHLAVHIRDRAELDRVTAAAPAHGWRLMFTDRHPYAGGPDHLAAYLENEEGFEVELVASERGV